MTDSHKPLSGQTAVVTGANSGIGEATARGIATAGGNVIVDYVADADAAEAVVNAITAEGGSAVAVRADVSDEEQVRRLFEAAADTFGGTDILVSNAGIQDDAPFVDMTLEQWQHVLSVNLTGAFLCAREAAREFLRRGVRPEVSRAAGKMIFISSVHEAIPWAGHVNYAASKGGLMQLMRSTAQELAPHHIRVNAIAPGAIRTRINRAVWSDEASRAELLDLIPCGRIGDPDDVARAAVWLASDSADYFVGETLFVDGGMTLYPGFATGG